MTAKSGKVAERTTASILRDQNAFGKATASNFSLAASTFAGTTGWRTQSSASTLSKNE
jgi:hypothetical protein